MRKKFEAFEKFNEFKEAAENESGLKSRFYEQTEVVSIHHRNLKTTSKNMKSDLNQLYSSTQQNRVAEHLNNTLIEAARSMVNHAGLTYSSWAAAIATATYLRKRMVTTFIKCGKMPYQLWYGEKPNPVS